MVTRRLRVSLQRDKKERREKRGAGKNRFHGGFQPPQNDPSGSLPRLGLPPLFFVCNHLPTYQPTYPPIHLSTCFFLCPDLLTNVPDSTSRVLTRGIPEPEAAGHIPAWGKAGSMFAKVFCARMII